MILLLVINNKVEKIISLMKASPKNIKFSDLLAVCVCTFFLENRGTMVKAALFLKPRGLVTPV